MWHHCCNCWFWWHCCCHSQRGDIIVVALLSLMMPLLSIYTVKQQSQSQHSGPSLENQWGIQRVHLQIDFADRIYITAVFCVCFRVMIITQIVLSFQNPERACRNNLGPAAKLQVGLCSVCACMFFSPFLRVICCDVLCAFVCEPAQHEVCEWMVPAQWLTWIA